MIESTNIENDETVPDVDEYEEIRIIHRRGLRTLFAPTPPHFAPATLTISNILDKAKKTDKNNGNDKNDQNDKNDENDKNDQNDNNDQNDQNDRNEKNDEADKDDENDNPYGYLPLKTQFRPRVTGLTRDWRETGNPEEPREEKIHSPKIQENDSSISPKNTNA